MDYKTKRTVFSSAVLVSSLIVCLICTVVLTNALNNGVTNLPNNTETPKATATAGVVTTPPASTQPPVTNQATPTQTYQNPPYTTGAQNTKTPDVTISVTTPPPTTEEPLDGDPILTYFQANLRSFNNDKAVYEVTLRFNAGGHVKMVAINSAYGFTTADINPTFVRDAISGKSRDYLATPNSFTSNIATENTNLTLTIETGLNPVDLFIIIDTDVENGLMSECILQKNIGFKLPTISGCTTPTVKDGVLTFDIQLNGALPEGASIQVTYSGGVMNSTTPNFIVTYNEQFSVGTMTARILCQNVTSSDYFTLPNIVNLDPPPETPTQPDPTENPDESTEETIE